MKWYHKNPDAKQLVRAHKYDAGLDIFSDEDVTFEKPTDVKTISTGLHVAIPMGMVGIIKPRSGLSVKFGTDTLAGVVDAGFRGELKVVMSALKTPFTLEKGSKIAQMIIVSHYDGPVTRVGSLEELGEVDDRGEAGFGSTGGF